MSGGRGASKPPVTYEGEYDDTRTYLPREIVMHEGTAYLATQKQTGVAPSGGGGGGGGGAAGFVWADRAGITLSANTHAGVTGVSALAFINTNLASAGVGSTTHTEDDYFLWDSSAPADLTIKQDGIYDFSHDIVFTPDAGASMEFYVSSATASDCYPTSGPFYAPDPAFTTADLHYKNRIHQVFAVHGGLTMTFAVDAYHGPATGTMQAFKLNVLKLS